MLGKKNYNILIVDDDLEFHKDTRSALRQNYQFDGAVDRSSMMEKIKHRSYDLLLLDLVLQEGSDEKEGLTILPQVFEKQPGLPVVIITADSDVETVVTAMKNGAVDYIHKDKLNYDILDKKFRKIIRSRNLEDENSQLKEEIKRLKHSQTNEYPFIGESKSIQRIKRTLRIVSEEPDLTVLITGETGVGKEVAARFLHRHGVRNSKPFQAVNLSAIQKTLLESELFGHVKGAFTGATRSKEGYFRQANGGVLMLDEIGDIDQNIQIKLLRFLETKLIRPVGSDEDIRLDVQIVAATHKDLRKEVEKNNFREDLFQRLKAKIIHIPPLRERKEDIALIVEHYLQKQQLTSAIFDEEAMAMLYQYPWKGNVRELRYAIDSTLLEMRILDKSSVDIECLPSDIQNYSPIHEIIPSESQPPEGMNGLGAVDNLDAERQKALIDLTNIESALIRRNKVKGDVATDLGYKSSDNLRYRVKTYYERFPELFDNFPTIRSCYRRVVSE